ncbi:MAG: hypothetical protein GY791_20345 [Alphaproteobacteria bacterium]|nr:hypothetical protein [Alphaproteobacteria bacterium]
MLGYTLLSYAFINGIAIKGFDPLIPTQAFLPRYLAVLVPLSVATIVLTAADLGTLVGSSLPSTRRRNFPAIGRNFAAISIGLVIAVLFLKSNQDAYVFDRQSHPFQIVDRYQEIVEEGMRDCALFVALDHKSENALRFGFLYDYTNLIKAERAVTDPHAAGIATECLERYPDWPAYLASQENSAVVDVIVAYREDMPEGDRFTIEERRIPISYLTTTLGAVSSK